MKAGRLRCHKLQRSKGGFPSEESSAHGPGSRTEKVGHMGSLFLVFSEEQKGAGVLLSSGSLLGVALRELNSKTGF